MDFLKKNWGLILFLIVTLGVVVYLTMAILAAKKQLDESQAKQQAHLKVLDDVRKSGRRIDAENLEKATREAHKAKLEYAKFHDSLAAKQLLPGIDMMLDLDDDAAVEAAQPKDEPELDEDGNPIPAKPKVDPYKDLPYRKLYDAWTQGSLLDARNRLQNAIIELNSVTFKSEEDDAQENAAVPRTATEARKAEARKAEADRKAEEEKEKAREAGKTMYDVQKEKRRKIVKGLAVPEYFMFEEYVLNRPSGLNSKKERRNVFRQFLLLKTLCAYLQKAEVSELEAIDFPCGLEIIDGDRYTATPVSMTVSGKPECVEAFLNLLNAGEEYIFYLRDIVSMNATVQLNADPALMFNASQEPASAKLEAFLASQAAAKGTAGATPDAAAMGGGRRRRGADDQAAMRQQGPANAAPGMMGPNMGMGMGPDGMAAQQQDLIPKTRKAFRIFAGKDDQAQNTRSAMDANAMMTPGQQNAGQNAAELGTRVQVTLNFEFVEFKPLAE
ncbi:MAG: hypothetical protein ACI4WT_10230 [Oligosphaeraceae bacterium]